MKLEEHDGVYAKKNKANGDEETISCSPPLYTYSSSSAAAKLIWFMRTDYILVFASQSLCVANKKDNSNET